MATRINPLVFELADLLRPAWPQITASIRSTGVPVAEGDPDPDPKPDPDPDPDPKPDPDPDPDPSRVTPDDDWKAKSRKNETRAKKAERERDEALAKLKERDDADQTEHEKALAKAREEARSEALTEAEKDRRNDRLEVASTRLAAKGFEIGEGDQAKTVKFADPDDALIHIERALRAGDVDEADIFGEDGKVQTAALQTALAEILDSKPHLRATENGGTPKGDPDTRRGHTADKDLEAMTPEDHAKRKYSATK